MLGIVEILLADFRTSRTCLLLRTYLLYNQACIHAYIPAYTHTHTHIYIYIYIYIDDPGEPGREGEWLDPYTACFSQAQASCL